MTLKSKAIFTAITILALLWLMYLSKEIITPFLCSLIAAYFLNPVVERFHEKEKMSRLHATTLILGLFVAIFVSLSLIILPTIYSQIVDLIDSLPLYIKTLNESFYPKIYEIAGKAGFEINNDLANIANKPESASRIINFSTDILNNAISSSVVILNVISLFFITPFLIFYLLKDWNVMTSKVNEYLPKEESSLLRRILREIDGSLSGYVRGQINVCLILGAIYAILLSCTGLNFGFVIGFLTGMLSFIPFVGMLLGVTSAIIVALFQWGFDVSQIAIISLFFIIGQVIESNFLTPKLIGSKIGLHPVWIIFSLFFFADLLGFVGVLVAVPLAAICSVIVKNLALEYKERFVDAA